MTNNLPADCTPDFCARFQPRMNGICMQQGMLPGTRVVAFDVSTSSTCCCQCGEQAGIAEVATPTGARRMNELCHGDSVLAAGPDLRWSAVPVRFSGGSHLRGAQTRLVRIAFEHPSQDAVSVVPDHVFLTRDGMLIRARDLGPGDTLAAADGGVAVIAAVETLGDYDGYIWRIATSNDAPDGLEDHLLNTQGVVSGDYALQLFFEDFVKAGLAHGAPRLA